MVDHRTLITHLCDELDHYRRMLLDDRQVTHPLADRTRAALSQPEPEVVGPTTMEIIELAEEIEAAELGQVDLVRAALARWGRPATAPAGEVGELVAWADEARYFAKELRDQADDLSPSLELFGLIHRAADLLERQQIQPVRLKKDDDIIRVHEMASILASIGEIESLEGLAYALLHHPRFTINPR